MSKPSEFSVTEKWLQEWNWLLRLEFLTARHWHSCRSSGLSLSEPTLHSSHPWPPFGLQYNADLSVLRPRSGEQRTQKLKSHPARTQSLNVLPFNLGIGQYIAIHATLTARDLFLAYFYPSGLFTCIFQNLSRFLLCWLWLTHSSCVDPQNKTGHPAGCRFPCWVPAEYK